MVLWPTDVLFFAKPLQAKVGACKKAFNQTTLLFPPCVVFGRLPDIRFFFFVFVAELFSALLLLLLSTIFCATIFANSGQPR